MRPTEERSPHGYWGGDDRPDPLVAQNAPEFVGQLRALVQWSGLSLEEIEQLARANGDILPPSIVSVALSHHILPPEEVVVALVAAIGDDDEMVELWASVLWRLEEMEAAATMAPQSMAPHGMTPYSAPPYGEPGYREQPYGNQPYSAMPMAQVSSVAGSRQYSGSALAKAVQKRRNQDSWTGLHRGFQKGLRATGLGSRFGRWPAPVAVSVAFLIFIGGVTWAMAGGSGDDNKAEPRSNACCATGSGGPKASASPQAEASASAMPVALPFPSTAITTGKPSPTPKQSPPRNSPSPAQTVLNPVLTGNGSASSCSVSGTDWVVTVTVSATLTGAPAGDNPQGRAGKPGDLKLFDVAGAGTTSFSGRSDPIVVGQSSETLTGSLQWSVTVTVTGAGSKTADGSASYSCTPAA